MKKLTVYVVSPGLGPSVLLSKILPLSRVERVERVLIIREKEEVPIAKCEYRRLRMPFRRAKHPVNSLWRGIGSFGLLLRESLRKPPDVIFVTYPFPYGLIGLAIARLIHRPILVHIIGGVDQVNTHFPPKWLWRRVNLWMFRHCDAVVTKGSRVSQYLAEQGVRPERLAEIKGGLDIEAFAPHPKLARDIDLLFVGSFTPLKGPDRVVNIATKLKAKKPNVRAVLLGDGPLRATVEQVIAERGLCENITLPGHVTNTWDYYRRAKVFILCSQTEGLSMAMLEAMAGGAVPVVPDVGNLTDGAKHGVNAMVVERYDDIDRYVEYVSGLLNNQERWWQFSQCAADFARAEFSYAADTARWQALLDQIVPASG